MISQATVQGFSTTLDQLSVAALADLQALTMALEGQSPERVKAVLFEAFPEVFDPYVAASSAVTATFYEEIRAASDVKPAFDAETIDAAPRPRWNALVGFGTRASLFEAGGMALLFGALSGGLTRTLTELSADTVVGNAERERVAVGFQRVPRAGCCAFCGLLASRGADYSSESGALKVAGRGVPVERNYAADGRRRRGGQARGIRVRGSRRIGQDFHDDCKCKAVPVFNDNYVEMQADADKYYDAYGAAREEVAKKRAAEGYAGYGDQATSQKLILAEMRSTLGVA